MMSKPSAEQSGWAVSQLWHRAHREPAVLRAAWAAVLLLFVEF